MTSANSNAPKRRRRPAGAQDGSGSENHRLPEYRFRRLRLAAQLLRSFGQPPGQPGSRPADGRARLVGRHGEDFDHPAGRCQPRTSPIGAGLFDPQGPLGHGQAAGPDGTRRFRRAKGIARGASGPGTLSNAERSGRSCNGPGTWSGIRTRTSSRLSIRESGINLLRLLRKVYESALDMRPQAED